MNSPHHDEAVMTKREVEALTIARVVAREAHRGQLDKAGEDYYLGHLSRMAVALDLSGHRLRMAGWLHDTVEDTKVSLLEIQSMFGREVSDIVDALTRRDDETYMESIHRVNRHPEARRVKLADIDDHLRDTTPLNDTMIDRYEKAREVLR
tara:strand:- start:9541 stop:9993 length:453 start_codon:yes stop_codon:yes gene_type:complete